MHISVGSLASVPVGTPSLTQTRTSPLRDTPRSIREGSHLSDMHTSSVMSGVTGARLRRRWRWTSAHVCVCVFVVALVNATHTHTTRHSAPSQPFIPPHNTTVMLRHTVRDGIAVPARVPSVPSCAVRMVSTDMLGSDVHMYTQKGPCPLPALAFVHMQKAGGGFAVNMVKLGET